MPIRRRRSTGPRSSSPQSKPPRRAEGGTEMARISRGFQGRRPQVDADRVPPGQYVTRDFPVLSAGPTPRTPLDEWSFAIRGAVENPVSWSWEDFVALPSETFPADIHCVTKGSKLDTTWTGVSLDTLLEQAEPK